MNRRYCACWKNTFSAFEGIYRQYLIRRAKTGTGRKIGENKKRTMEITPIYSCYIVIVRIVRIHRLENPNCLTYGNVELASKL